MGAMAEAMVAYAQPLFDKTDGSIDQMQNAFSIAQACWNLALLPEAERDASLAALRPALKMSEAEFVVFCETIIAPMILRHHAMFPDMPRLASSPAEMRPHTKAYQGTGPYEPCPCNSGKKYKWCCGTPRERCTPPGRR